MGQTTSPGDDLKAALGARRELGGDYEDAVVASFVDHLGKEIDARVEARLAAAPQPAARDYSLLLAVASLILGSGVTGGLATANHPDFIIAPDPLPLILVTWIGIVLVNIVYMLGRRR